MITERVGFLGATGHTLAARLDRPDGAARAAALFAHCFTCTKDIFAADRIAKRLVEHGFAVLRFDFTGLGSSAGEFANTDFSSNVGDLVAAAGWLAATHRGPDLLVGHSLGGAAVLAAAERLAQVRAVATIGAPFDPGHATRLLGDRLAEIERDGKASVTLAGRTFTISRAFVEDIRAQPQERRIAALGRPLLILHSPLDDTVGIENAQRIYQAAKHPKSFVSLDSADHLLTRREDAAYVADVLAAWASRYLDPAAATAEPPAPQAPAGTVVVEETGDGAFQQRITSGPHRLLADEPAAFGGTDTGPGPYDLLLASLGACTSMTIRLYANGKGWPLERVRVDLRHDRIHAEDCRDCETRTGKIDRIRRTVHLAGPLDDAQRARLLEIADKCPVHRTLHGEILVDTELAEPR